MAERDGDAGLEGVQRHFIAQLDGQDLRALAECLSAIVDSSQRVPDDASRAGA